MTGEWNHDHTWRGEIITKGELHDMFLREAKETEAAAAKTIEHHMGGLFPLTAKDRRMLYFCVRVYTRSLEDMARDLKGD